MKYLVGFLAGVLVALGMSGRAENWLVVSGYAIHLDGDRYCNSWTEGLGYEYQNGAHRTQIGAYHNSNCRWSVYAGQGYTPLRIGRVSLGGIVGGVTGYKHEVTPLAAAFAVVEGEKWGVSLIYVPEVKESGNVAWLQIRRRF